jgi:hypothetical protein
VPVTDQRQIKDVLEENLRSLSKDKQDFLQDFYDLDDATVRAAFDTMLETFASRVMVADLYQGAGTNEDSAELVKAVTEQLRQPA